jgi:hypothetical protein
MESIIQAIMDQKRRTRLHTTTESVKMLHIRKQKVIFNSIRNSFKPPSEQSMRCVIKQMLISCPRQGKYWMVLRAQRIHK